MPREPAGGSQGAGAQGGQGTINPGTGLHGSNANQRRWLSMSKQRKNTRRGNATTPRAGARRAAVAAIVLLAVVIGAPLGFGWWRAEQADTPPTAPSTQATATPSPAAMAATAPGVQKLQGKWLRPDGGYVIEVRNVEDGGTMDVAYFNPGRSRCPRLKPHKMVPLLRSSLNCAM